MTEPENETPKTTVVCARADSPLTVPGASFDKFCSQCGARVMIAPTGIAFLAGHPEAEILCSICCMEHLKNGKYDKETTRISTPAGLEEIFKMIPNTYRNRN